MLETLETPIHPAEKKLVLKAISDSAGKITVADISTKTALPILKASALLNQIAYETGGHLTVGTAGNVVYEFDPNFQNIYLTRGSKNFFKRIGRIALNAAAYAARIFALVMFFIIRVSFGIILVLSVVLLIAIIVFAIIALISKSMGDDSGDSPNIDLSGFFGGFGEIFRYFMFDWIWDWWYWGSYIRWDPSPDYSPAPTKEKEKEGEKDKESFLDKCFSFLFGDGNPNQNLEERYWQTLARVLKAKNGVVVAEQLAPYSIVEGRNEDWVLPILVRFNGTCDVSENGNIIYSFPSFQQKTLETPGTHPKQAESAPASAQTEELHTLFRKHLESQKASNERHSAEAHLESYLRERPWELSHVKGGARTTIICLAVFLLLGGIWATTMVLALPFLLPLIPLLLAMAAYGAMFLIVPGIRHLFIQNFNNGIEKRNSTRFSAATKLTNPDPDLRKKLTETEQARRQALQAAMGEEVAYTTDKDLLEQRFENKNLDGEPGAESKNTNLPEQHAHKPQDIKHKTAGPAEDFSPTADDQPQIINIKEDKETLREKMRKKADEGKE